MRRKTYLLFYIAIFVLPRVSTAQLSYNLVDTASLNLSANLIKQNAGIEILSTNNANYGFQWRVLEYFIPANWQSNGICDWEGCYPFQDTAWHYRTWNGNIPANRLFYSAKRYINSGPGCAIVKVEYKEQGQSTTNITNLIITSYANVTSCWPLSVKRDNIEELAILFPNPASDKVYLDIRNENVQTLHVRTIYGRVLFTMNRSNAGTYIPVTQYPAGLYMVELKDIHGIILGVTGFVKK